MRTLMIAALVTTTALAATPAEAARDSGAKFRGGGSYAGGQRQLPPRFGTRWGNKIQGRWHAGFQAPGGWRGYRRPVRGFVVPSFWVSPSFLISNYQAYGLSQPAYGYNWSRYYDDAVLMDRYGRVYDSVGGMDWDRYDQGSGYDQGEAYDQGAGYDQDYYDQGGYDQGGSQSGYAPPQQPGYDPRYQRRDNGVGGAVIGGVVGGVAGNVIAGRGNRLGGTLIGAGVGAVAGYAVDRAEDRRGRRDAPPPPPGYGYQQPGAGYAPPSYGYPEDQVTYGRGAQRPPIRYTPSLPQTYYSPAGTTTTIVIQSAAPVTTTTTTTYIEEEEVVYTAARKPYRPKKAWKPKPKPSCVCR